MTDLLDLFHQLIRFETELWNAVDARLRAELSLPLSRFEPMQVGWLCVRLAVCTPSPRNCRSRSAAPASLSTVSKPPATASAAPILRTVAPRSSSSPHRDGAFWPRPPRYLK